MRLKRPRGYVLMLVLVLVLILTLLGARLMQTTFYDTFAMSATQFQSQAVLNSYMGVQEGLARLRTGQVIVDDLPWCFSADTCDPLPVPKIYNDRDGADFNKRRYTVTLFKRKRPPGPLTFDTTPLKVVVISAEGYATADGEALATTSFSSVTEVDVSVPAAGGGIAGSGDSVGNSFGGGG